MNFEPQTQKGLQNDQKALGFSLWTTWVSAMSKNLIKPVENEDLGGTISAKASLCRPGPPAWTAGPQNILFQCKSFFSVHWKKIPYNMPRGNSGGAMYCIIAVTFLIWPVPPAMPVRSVCVVMQTLQWVESMFSYRIFAEPGSVFQAGEFAVRGRWARSTLTIVEFSKDFQGFRATVQR